MLMPLVGGGYINLAFNFCLWKGLTFCMEVVIKPLDEISFSACSLSILETQIDQTCVRSSWENVFLPQRQLRNTEVAQPPSCKLYWKGSTKGSKGIFGEHTNNCSAKFLKDQK